MLSQWISNPTGLRPARQALLALAYFATATLGLRLAAPGTNATAIWIPTGLAMAAVLRWGPGLWPGIFLGAFAANALHLATLGLPAGSLVGVALATSLGNTAEALLAGYLIQRSTGTRQPFDSGPSALAFIGYGAGLSAGLSALVGTSAFCLATGHWVVFSAMVSAWWVGDAVGALLLVPPLLTFSQAELRALPRRAHEEALLAAILILALWAAKGLLAPPLTFLYLPILVFAALRLHLFYAASLAALLATLTTLGTLAGINPVNAAVSLHAAVFLQQFFLGTLAITALVLSATVREKQEMATSLLQRSRLYQTLSEVNQAILRALDRRTLLEVTCRTLVQFSGFRMAWVGFKDEATGRLRPEASAGVTRSYLDAIVIRWDDAPEAQGPSGRALREARGVVCSDCLHDPAFAPWRQGAQTLGYRTSGAFPIRQGGTVVGALMIYHAQAEAIGAEDRRLLEELATGLGSALEALQTKNELKESERRLRETLEQVELLAVTLDRQATILFCNDYLLRVTGWSREEVLGRAWFEAFLPPEVRAEVEALFTAAIQAGQVPLHYDNEILTRGGARRLVRWNNTILRDLEGTIVGTVSLGEDITDRKRAEAALRDSEARYRALFEHAPEGILIADAQGTYLDANPSICRLLGYSREELVGRSATDILVPTEIRQIEPALNEIKSPSGHHREWRFTRRDGSVFQGEMDAATMPDERILATVRDITGRKAAEEALAQRADQLAVLHDLGHSLGSGTMEPLELAQVALEGIVKVQTPDLALLFLREGEDLRLLHATSGPAHLQHDQTPAHCLGQCLCGLAAEDGRALYALDIQTDPRCTWDECKRAGVKSFAVLPLKSGEEVIGVLGLASATQRDFQQQSAFLETLAAQVAVGLQNALLNEGLKARAANLEQVVEERTALLREANKDLGQAVEHAQMADQAKSAFLSAMSHELRTPLNSVIGFTGVLLKGLVGDLKPGQREPLEIVQRNGRHLLDLINDVLDLSKIEATEMRLSHLPFDLVQTLREALEVMAPAAAAKGLALTDTFAVETLPFLGDRRRLSQILLNLLSNAVKFTESGTVTLDLTLASNQVRIAVRDTGPGIAREDLPRLFRAFEQLDSGLARRNEGTGLGLALSLRLARLMHGDILVQSEPLQGTTFSLILPLAEGDLVP